MNFLVYYRNTRNTQFNVNFRGLISGGLISGTANISGINKNDNK